MKYLCCLLFSAASAAFGAQIGDTYQQVIAEKGNPQSQLAAGARRVLQYPDMSIVIKNDVVINIRLAEAAAPGLALPEPLPANSPPATRQEHISALKQELSAAVAQVQRIVNQPVTAQPDQGDMLVATYKPGWFHDGAIRPDFTTVDVRKTQQFPYAGHEYVSSNLNPGVVFLGRELEFNPMTKYFYTDRSVPKKKLTESEMLEINRLYRIIGRCEQQLGQLHAPQN